MRTSFLLAAALCFLPLATVRAQDANQTLDASKKAADEVISRGSLDSRNDVKAVFDYADALGRMGKDKEALDYYEKGLQIHAWSLPNQLRFAQLLMKAGKKDLAVERAKLVVENAEQDALVIPALALLGKDKDAEANTFLPPLARIEAKGPAVVLVAMGQVDPLILKAALPKIQKELPIPVCLQQSQVQLPPPSREPLKEFLATFRKEVQGNASDRGVVATLKSLGMKLDDLKDDKKLLQFYRELVLKSGGEDKVAQLDAAVESLSHRDSQWDVVRMREVLAATIQSTQQDHVRYLGITKLDIYSADNNYVFAQHGNVSGVVSYRRFMYDMWGEEVPKRPRLMDRFTKQCVSSAGRLFGLSPCSNPTCVAAYPNSVEELDAKHATFCPACQKKLQEAIAQEKGR
jgi:predicted Zn-dependent protease